MDPLGRLEEVRKRISEQQREILRTIWTYFLANGRWIPIRALHIRCGGKATVQEALKPLGGSVVLEDHNSGEAVYRVTLLGVLVSTAGHTAHGLLSEYLRWIRERALTDGEMQHVTADLVSDALKLSESDARQLYELIRLGDFWAAGVGGGPSWRVGLPSDVEDLPEDPAAYIAAKALEQYDAHLPFEANKRDAYIFQKSSVESSLFTAIPVRIRDRGDQSNIAFLQPEILHQSLAGRVYDLLISGAYDTAVFEAFREVEFAVRQASNLAAEDVGVWLMRRAFDKRHGSLTDARVPEAEREATAHLFAGAIGLFKNPRSHRHAPIADPIEAVELILLASHLLRIVDSRSAPPEGSA